MILTLFLNVVDTNLKILGWEEICGDAVLSGYLIHNLTLILGALSYLNARG